MLGLGSMDAKEEVLDSGLMVADYESGLWVGYKFPANPFLGWTGGGNSKFDFTVNSVQCSYSCQQIR